MNMEDVLSEKINIFKNCVDDHEHLDIYIPDEY